ncbi:thermonuclease family protein [Sphingomonas suaedae]|uniref:Thermonuclease family protein n=1 Tax=Sphingomonas suaedae TaxID=2599297 RepID=A0A518RLG6_9SPHN|nr:thermonuclease family protein [Sphingomonas suaedae]
MASLLLGSCAPTPAQSGSQQVTGVAKVSDGDTLVIAGERVRLFGIDAPEHGQRCGPARTPCDIEASEALRRLTAGNRVTCNWRERDRYDRPLGTCRVGKRDLNAAMVAQGWAIAYRRYSEAYVREEATARAAQLGLWRTGFEPPEAYRASKRQALPPQVPPRADCPIKGNIATSGARIYHLPSAQGYDQVRINLGEGERWFCSASEAEAAGWRPRR